MTRCGAPSWGVEAMMRPSLPILGLALLAPALAHAQAAEWTCTFKTECRDDECATSGYEAALALTPMSIDAGVATLQATLSDDAETLTMAGMDQNGLQRLFNIESAAGSRLLTISPDGKARYTTHIADPAAAVTYIGRCEEAK